MRERNRERTEQQARDRMTMDDPPESLSLSLWPVWSGLFRPRVPDRLLVGTQVIDKSDRAGTGPAGQPKKARALGLFSGSS